MPASRRRHLTVQVVVAALTIVPMACGSDSSDSATPDGERSGDAGPLSVVASFYPLQFVVERVGGDRVVVANLTPVGGEPHDLDLTAADAATLQDSDLVVTLGGLSGAVDDAVELVGDEQVIDVRTVVDLDLQTGDEDGVDLHFWLDPSRLARVVDELASRLSSLDPGGIDAYEANAAALRGELERLDADFAAGLADCASTDIVTSHNAFGYLAARYGFTQVGITGLTPENEPSPRDLADVADFVAINDVRTIYYETLVSPSIAETVAAETGAATDVLDPLEGLSDESAGDDYLEVMRANLDTLRRGQGCA